MPEGHTIHRLARDLRRDLAGRDLVVSSPQGRFATSAADIAGATLTNAEAAGKHLFLHWDAADRPDDDAALLHIHLGLIGKFRPVPAEEPIRGEIRLRLDNGEWAWQLSGPQTCALVEPVQRIAVLDGLGPDPLRRDGHAEPFIERMARSKKAVGAILLDQDVIAGIGNVYRAEFLFMLGIHPSTPARELRPDDAREMWDLATELLRIGVRLNRIVTVTPEDAGTSRGRLRREDSLYAYKREGLPCRRCGTEIVCGPVAGRTIWWCPKCQRR